MLAVIRVKHRRIAINIKGKKLGPGCHFDVCDSIELCIVELTRVPCILLCQKGTLYNDADNKTVSFWDKILNDVVQVLISENMILIKWFAFNGMQANLANVCLANMDIICVLVLKLMTLISNVKIMLN